MRITLHQLHVFKEIAKQGSVTRAGERLCITQPSVSNILRQLENYYGCALIEVICKKLYLTSGGEILLNGCMQLDACLEKIRSEIDSFKGSVTGTLKLAIVSTAEYFVPRLLGAFKQKNPFIRIQMKVCNRDEIINRLKTNEDDFVIMSQPPDLVQIDRADFYEDSLVVVASPINQYAKKYEIKLQEIANDRWIVREPGSGTRLAMLNIFKKNGIEPGIEMELGNNESIKQAVIANIGISIIPKQSIELELRNHLICVLPVKGFPIQHKWYLIKNKDKKTAPISEKFYAFVRNSSAQRNGMDRKK